MPQADQFSGDAAATIADRNPLMAPDAVEREATARMVLLRRSGPQPEYAFTSGYGDPDGRG